MRRKFKIHQILVLATTALSILLAAGVIVRHPSKASDDLKALMAGMPTIGSQAANVEVVIFEDFFCQGCRIFNEEIFPQIESRYIASKRVRYTFVPLAFIAGSKPLANAAFAVHKIAPAQFFPYARKVFRWMDRLPPGDAAKPLLLDLAKKVGKIDLEKLQQCIETNCYYEELDQQYLAAKKFMGKKFGTPALFVNGKATSTASFLIVQQRIEKTLEEAAP